MLKSQCFAFIYQDVVIMKNLYDFVVTFIVQPIYVYHVFRHGTNKIDKCYGLEIHMCIDNGITQIL